MARGTTVIQPDETASKDNYIQEDAATTNRGTNLDVQAIMSAAGQKRRTIIQFDLSSIDANSTIHGGTLAMVVDIPLTSDQTSVYRITQSWTELGATWNTYDGASNWTSPGGDFDSTVRGSANPGTVAGNVVSWPITSLIQDWVSGTTNNGMLLKLTTETGSTKGATYLSSGNGTAANRPKLTIDWTPPGASNFIGYRSLTGVGI